MDVSILHTLTEDLAAFLSEVTQGDLRRPVPSTTGDVGDLYLHVIDQNVSVATAITGQAILRGTRHHPMDRASLGASVDYYGDCGLEAGYRQTAHLMENSFASTADSGLLYQPKGFPDAVELTTLYEVQISNAIIHTWDVAQALGLPYRPDPHISQRVLRAVVPWLAEPLPGTLPGNAASSTAVTDDADIFESILKLSGRNAGVAIKADSRQRESHHAALSPR
ncbi:hypothetical protein [Phytoactinopolyspora limicola]|uniref:hypothetical protein n=1 Tax=Phytoactinopolyspora limicola TaxID=2715536 RepID=UPI001407E436|nr:hypothetical protein [Phytoactinopolyspora limicola]